MSGPFQPVEPPDSSTSRPATERFPRRARLTRPGEFKRVFDGARTSGDRAFRVLACVGTTAQTRLGMAVSRQIDRRASGRNRIKRVVRESFRRHFGPGGPFDSTVPLDIVVLPRRGCASISNAELAASLDQHWERIVAQFQPQPAGSVGPHRINRP